MWLALVVVPVAVVEDGGLEVFGAVVFFDAEHEGHHVVIDAPGAILFYLTGCQPYRVTYKWQRGLKHCPTRRLVKPTLLCGFLR